MTVSIRDEKEAVEHREHSHTAAETGKHGFATELLLRMQSTLDIRDMISIILDQVNRKLPIDGLSYVNDSHSIQVQAGKQATHSCGYRLVTRDEHLGELTFQRMHSFRDEELQTLESVLSLILAPLRNALQFRRALNASLCDPVSGARNRKCLDDMLPREIELAKRHNRPLAVLLIEIDQLSAINRQFSHRHGDRAVRLVADKIDALSRDTDMLFHLNSETFVLLLHESDRAGARITAERLQHMCKAEPCLVDGQEINISLCMGLVCLTGTDSPQSMLDRGMRNLKKAQEKGSEYFCG